MVKAERLVYCIGILNQIADNLEVQQRTTGDAHTKQALERIPLLLRNLIDYMDHEE